MIDSVTLSIVFVKELGKLLQGFLDRCPMSDGIVLYLKSCLSLVFSLIFR